MKRVLVTGSTGFLGAATLERMGDLGYAVTAITRRAVDVPHAPDVLTFDLTSNDDAMKALVPWRWDAVVHLAGEINERPAPFDVGARLVEDHVRMALNLTRALPERFAGPVIYSSSMTVCGFPKRLPVREEDQRCPSSPYALGKALAEDVVLSRCANAWVMRLPGLFAEWRKAGAISAFARAAVAGSDIRVTAPEPTPWDVLHVGDAAEAIRRALQSSSAGPGVINVSYGEPVELVAVAKRVADLGGQHSRVIAVDGVEHPRMQFDIERARRLLEWPPARLEDRLAQIVSNAREASI